MATALAVAAVVCALLTIAEPAQAHDQLIASTPTDGEVLPVAPEEVVLQFSDELNQLAGTIVVTDAAEQSWTEGDLVFDDTRARITLAPDMPDGWYEIRWQVVSRDGHPISGILAFAVGDAGERPTTEPATADAGADDTTTEGTDNTGLMRTLLVGLSGAVIAGGGYWLAVRLLRRRGSPLPTDDHPSP